MVAPEEIILTIPEAVLSNLSFIINLLQAVGVVIIAYVVFNIINFFLSRKKGKEIVQIRENLEEIKKILKSKYKKRK